jgi:hypothetical protein
LKRVATKRELVRHLNAKHPDYSEPRRFHCPHLDCPYSIQGPKLGISRKDTLKRHLENMHFGS